MLCCVDGLGAYVDDGTKAAITIARSPLNRYSFVRLRMKMNATGSSSSTQQLLILLSDIVLHLEEEDDDDDNQLLILLLLLLTTAAPTPVPAPSPVVFCDIFLINQSHYYYCCRGTSYRSRGFFSMHCSSSSGNGGGVVHLG